MSAGLLQSTQTLLAGLVSLGRTRFELFGIELREELARLTTVLAWGLRRLAALKPRAFDSTLAELERDYEALKP
jgi:uncharacterized membrane protein YqjE